MNWNEEKWELDESGTGVIRKVPYVIPYKEGNFTDHVCTCDSAFDEERDREIAQALALAPKMIGALHEAMYTIRAKEFTTLCRGIDEESINKVKTFLNRNPSPTVSQIIEILKAVGVNP